MWQKLEAFCRQPDQRFECEGAGDHESERYVACIEHRLQDMANAQQLTVIRQKLGDLAEQFVDFYQRHNGALLYCDTLSDTAGVWIAPVDEWDGLHKDWQGWLECLFEEDYEDIGLTESEIKQAVVFGEVPHSGNYFLFLTSGDDRGKVYYFCHDGLEFEPYADDLNQFVQRIFSDPVQVLDHLGCYARYSDGKPDIQWIPLRFLTGDD